MLDVEIPVAAPGSGPRMLAAFRACLSSVLEIPIGAVPHGDSDLRTGVAQWRTWLAGRGVGLVPIADASRFQWSGYWIGVLSATPEFQEAAVLMFGTPPGVVLSPQDSALLGRPAADLPIAEGYVAAPFDPALSADSAAPTQRGRVEAIAVADRAEAPMQDLTTARAIPGRGLEGDRYAKHAGTFSSRSGKGVGYDLTLIEAEVLDELTVADGNRLGYMEARRNIVTRGIDLNSLVGQRFKVGDAECIGRRLCEPCAHLEKLTHRGVLRGLIHRGGLRADILTPGTISIGAALETVRD